MKTTVRPKGFATMIARSEGCHPEYVRMLLRGNRKSNSELAKRIFRKAEEMQAVIGR